MCHCPEKVACICTVHKLLVDLHSKYLVSMLTAVNKNEVVEFTEVVPYQVYQVSKKITQRLCTHTAIEASAAQMHVVMSWTVRLSKQ